MEVWQEDARNRASTDPAAGLWDSRSNTSKPPRMSSLLFAEIGADL